MTAAKSSHNVCVRCSPTSFYKRIRIMTAAKSSHNVCVRCSPTSFYKRIRIMTAAKSSHNVCVRCSPITHTTHTQHHFNIHVTGVCWLSPIKPLQCGSLDARCSLHHNSTEGISDHSCVTHMNSFYYLKHKSDKFTKYRKT